MFFLSALLFCLTALGAYAVAQEIKTTGTSCSNATETYFWEQASICNTTSGQWQRPAFQLGAAMVSCSATAGGLVQWTGTGAQYCNGTSWVDLDTE